MEATEGTDAPPDIQLTLRTPLTAAEKRTNPPPFYPILEPPVVVEEEVGELLAIPPPSGFQASVVEVEAAEETDASPSFLLARETPLMGVELESAAAALSILFDSFTARIHVALAALGPGHCF